MAIMRTRSHLTFSAPPPSPIPTAKGSRSAALNDQILAEYFEKTLHVPDLTLPQSHFQVSMHRPILAEIDLPSLISRAGDSMDQLLRSAKEFGVFRISGHEISVEELRSTVAEAESTFINSEKRKPKFRGGRNGNREEFVCFRSAKATMECAQEAIVVERYRSFRRKMENVASKLDAIAEEVGQVFLENAGKQFRKKIQERDSVLSLYRYSHDNLIQRNLHLPNEKNCESCDHALSLHLALEQSEFCVESGRGPLSFDTGPDTIVATVGEQLEEWSLGEFESVSGELSFEPDLHGSGASFSIELKSSPNILNSGLNKINKRISIADQILIALIFALLYKFFEFISS